MPLVFVHGVAVRQSRRHQAQAQRDALFRRLVLPRSAAVFDPDWGSVAFKFDPTLPSMAEPADAQPFAVVQGGQVGTIQVGMGGMVRRHPDRAVGLAFEADLALRAESAARRGDPAEALGAKEREAFEAAVRYLEAGADRTAFDPFGSDTEFISALALEGPFSPGPQARAMIGSGRDSAGVTLRGATFFALRRVAEPDGIRP
jgi:hypothetical protein